jgi:hypothetical protein
MRMSWLLLQRRNRGLFWESHETQAIYLRTKQLCRGHIREQTKNCAVLVRKERNYAADAFNMKQRRGISKRSMTLKSLHYEYLYTGTWQYLKSWHYCSIFIETSGGHGIASSRNETGAAGNHIPMVSYYKEHKTYFGIINYTSADALHLNTLGSEK